MSSKKAEGIKEILRIGQRIESMDVRGRYKSKEFMQQQADKLSDALADAEILWEDATEVARYLGFFSKQQIEQIEERAETKYFADKNATIAVPESTPFVCLNCGTGKCINSDKCAF